MNSEHPTIDILCTFRLFLFKLDNDEIFIIVYTIIKLIKPPLIRLYTNFDSGIYILIIYIYFIKE